MPATSAGITTRRGDRLYSEGVGIITALSQGLEGKFRDRIQAALRLDKDYWTARRRSCGALLLQASLAQAPRRRGHQGADRSRAHPPTNLRAKLYLADCYADADRVEEGMKLVREILDAPPGQDPPEERRLKKKARNWIEAHGPPNTAQ